MNSSWCPLYPEARISHLTRCHSDHCPILLETFPRRMTYLNRPFRFQSFWLSNPSFPKVVNQAWRRARDLSKNIENFDKEAKLWDKNHFGNIFAKKKRIMAWLDGVQRAMAYNPFPPLIQLENQLLKELDMVKGQETELWALKARMNWLVLSDWNTSFYHFSALTRRKRNQISPVKTGAGDWILEDREVMNYFRDGFHKLYTTS